MRVLVECACRLALKPRGWTVRKKTSVKNFGLDFEFCDFAIFLVWIACFLLFVYLFIKLAMLNYQLLECRGFFMISVFAIFFEFIHFSRASVCLSAYVYVGRPACLSVLLMGFEF